METQKWQGHWAYNLGSKKETLPFSPWQCIWNQPLQRKKHTERNAKQSMNHLSQSGAVSKFHASMIAQSPKVFLFQYAFSPTTNNQEGIRSFSRLMCHYFMTVSSSSIETSPLRLWTKQNSGFPKRTCKRSFPYGLFIHSFVAIYSRFFLARRQKP